MQLSIRLKQAAALAATAAVAVTFAVSSSPAGASTSPHWAPAATATIHPGTQMFTAGAQCTANFVFANGATVYVGYAAHCAGKGSETDTDGCTTASLPLGTKVSFNQGANLASNGTRVGTGTLVYSSWITMKQVHETNANTCAYNDLALVRVDPKFVKDVNPSVPFWGGPDKLATHGTQAGDTIYSYGNSLLRGGIETFSPKQGVSLGDSAGGWTHTVYTVSPGIPGDSGSGFMDANGNALGVLSTIELAPEVGSNGVGDLPRELAYANSHGMAGVHLVPGTQHFAPIV